MVAVRVSGWRADSGPCVGAILLTRRVERYLGLLGVAEGEQSPPPPPRLELLSPRTTASPGRARARGGRRRGGRRGGPLGEPRRKWRPEQDVDQEAARRAATSEAPAHPGGASAPVSLRRAD